MISSLIQMIRDFSDRVRRDRVTVYGAQAAFFVIISAVPSIMLVIALLQFIMPLSQSQMSRLAMDVVPMALRSYVIRIIDELYHQTTLPLISITALSALWAASRSLYALAGGLKQIYGTVETRSYLRLRLSALFDTLLFIILLIVSLVLLVFGNQIQLFLEGALPQIAGFATHLIGFRTLLAVTILSLIFCVMYHILPDSKNNFRGQLPGAVFSALGWMIFSLAYSLYIDHFSRVSYLYGSLTAIVLLMLWLYFCMNIFLIGAEINVWLQENDPPQSTP